ncbi:putative beta-lysine N-acetyltransferase [Marinilabilia sp.]|jgi:putative beta-lysine N-acetyltransferase
MDKTEIIGQSTIQHGPESNRVYLMHMWPSDFPDIINKMDELAKTNGYTKLFAKVPSRYGAAFRMSGYETEAIVPGFFNGTEDALFLVKYFDIKRRTPNAEEMDVFQNLLLSETNSEIPGLDNTHVLRLLTPDDTEEMTSVFAQVFDSYPFPIFDTEFLKKEMSEETRYFGVFQDGKLVGISSAECDDSLKNAEMTDFAVLPSQRGKKIAIHLLRAMEEHLISKGFKSFYTIARLKSPSMNKTFMNNDYRYTGTLVNNTQIAGQIESMNVWYKTV